MQATIHRRSTFTAVAPISLQCFTSDLFSDSRFHGYQGPSRNVRLSRATTNGGGTIAKSEDGLRCVVAGKESLRILRLTDPEETTAAEQKSVVGRGGHRIELARNLWDGSGLKIDSASTDVGWCSGSYNHKILTSARNGDLIMWDLNKSGSTKYERKTKNHIRSIHKLSCSSIVPYYCITGSADGDMRIWDLRDMSRSVMKIHHPTSVRSLVFSLSLSHPLQAIVGLDNGSIYRWDLQMGQRGQLDRLPVAHTGPILSLDWYSTSSMSKTTEPSAMQLDRSWIVSGGLDHTVKVWDLPASSTSSHLVNKPVYVLHPSFPVRRVLWRPNYPCELALVSNAEFTGTGTETLASPRMQNVTPSFISAISPVSEVKDIEGKSGVVGDAVEIWDVRRGWIGKWTVDANVSDGGVTDAVFRDSHALLVQHASGTFAQIDLRYSHRPIDAIPRQGLSWNAVNGLDGALAFVADKKGKWEIPYDDVHPDKRSLLADRKLRVKALGDKSRTPCLQNMGMYVRVPPVQVENTAADDFVRLAKGYVVPEKPIQKKEVCALNARVALQVGNVHAAEAWILLGSLLTDVVPESISTSISSAPKAGQPYPLIHSNTAPAIIPSEGVGSHGSGLILKAASHRTTSADSAVHLAQSPHHSPSQSRSQTNSQTPRSSSNNGNISVVPSPSEERKHQRQRSDVQPPPPPTKPPPNSRNMTPASSASSSPRHITVPLPATPVLPPTTTMTPATVAGRRPSVLVPPAPHVRRPSVYSRVTSAHSETPSVASASISDRSLRHVGEGALDDSDSSEGAASDSVAESHISEVDHMSVDVPSTPASVSGSQRPLMTKARSLSSGRAGPVHPSPLSRLAGQQKWPEDEEDSKRRIDNEDDEASPSPVSSDTDGDRSDEDSDADADEEVRRRMVTMKSHSISRSRSRKNSSANARRVKSRSRSSTVVSLAALPMVSPVRSSPGSPQGHHTSGVVARRGSQSSVQTVIATSVREQENEGRLVEIVNEGEREEEREPASWAEMSHRQRVEVMEEEHRFREAGWSALRDALEEYADEGDVQMCAMLALVAPTELKLDLGRTIRFVEAYVDMLMRHRLHTCAAYLRRYSQVEEVQKTTRLETIIYTACRKCRKPIVAARSKNPFVRGTYSICTNCKEEVAKCSICHLPVRTLLFQCSVCSHGGHQECYRRFYMERPMVELPVSSLTRGRQLQRDHDGENEPEGRSGSDRGRERCMSGHPCAAGCGHFCWVAIGRKNDDRDTSPNIEGRMNSSR